MTTPFARWDDARAAASSPEELRALLSEVARWRAMHLTDVVGQRDATWAIARIQQSLGQTEAALREARSLVSLCRTPPEAKEPELYAAEDLVAELGGPRPKRRSKKPSKPAAQSDRRGRDNPRSAPQTALGALEQSVVHGREGNYSEAFRVLRGKGGPRVQIIRTWLDLKQAIEGPAESRDEALSALLGRLEKGLPRVPEAPAPAQSAPPEKPDGSRLGALVGRNLPQRRAKALRMLQSWLDRNPEQADAAAGAALLDHLDASGTAPAPWLAGFVAQGLLAGGEQTRAAMKSLAEAGSVALAIYDEPQFEILRDLLNQALREGLRLVDLRRGVLRSEPEDRRLWTLRLSNGASDGVITLAASSDEPLDDALAAELAKRVRGLSEVMVLVAPGAGNAALRAGASVLDVAVVELEQALPTLRKALGTAPARRPAPSSNPAPAASDKPAPKKPAAPSHAERVQAVGERLRADPVPTAEELEPMVAPIKRVRDVLDIAEQLDGADTPERLKAVVLAVHRTVPERVRLLQATTLLLKASAREGGQGLLELLTAGEPSERLGGPGIESVIAASAAVQADGWSLERVLRGVTRRERRERPALDVLADHLEPLWRIIVQKDGIRGEIWVADALPPEGQAGLPQLALREAPRVGVVGEALQPAWTELGGPAFVPVAELPAALASWGA